MHRVSDEENKNENSEELSGVEEFSSKRHIWIKESQREQS